MKPQLEELEPRCVLDTAGAFDGNATALYLIVKTDYGHELHVHDHHTDEHGAPLPDTDRVPVPLPIATETPLENISVTADQFTQEVRIGWRELDGKSWIVTFTPIVPPDTAELSEPVFVMDVFATPPAAGIAFGADQVFMQPPTIPSYVIAPVSFNPFVTNTPEEFFAATPVIAADEPGTIMVGWTASHDYGQTWEAVHWQTLDDFWASHGL